MTNLPRRSISILSRLGYSLRWHPSRLGPTPRQASPPTLKCQPKGVPDRNSHDPTDTSNQRKPFNSPWITLRSHQSKFVLNRPRVQLGEVPRNTSLVHGILKSSPRVLLQRYFPLRGVTYFILLVISLCLNSPLRSLTRLLYLLNST